MNRRLACSSENLFLTRLLIGLCQVAEKGTQEVNNFRNLCFLSLLKQVGDTGSHNCGYCCAAHVKIGIIKNMHSSEFIAILKHLIDSVTECSNE